MTSRARYCHNCGERVPYQDVTSDTVCVRCQQHLHACGNCVYFDGIACEIDRPEQHHVYPGRECPQFEFRRTLPPE